MRRKKKVREPQYYHSQTNMPVLNYKVYDMSAMEKLGYWMLAFVVGCGIGYLFYGGLGKDEYGNSTTVTHICNIVVSGIVGILATRFFLPVREKQLCEKRKKELRNQFVDMLDALATSLGAGKNVNDSFVGIYGDMKVQYGKGAYITKEIGVIITGMNNNIPVEALLLDFGKRSGINDIANFAKVFSTAFRKGGNLKDIIRNTHQIIHDKIEIEMEIESLVASNKMEQNIMIVLPILLVAMLKMTSPEFATNFSSISGIFATTFAVVSFVAAYMIGQKVLDINCSGGGEMLGLSLIKLAIMAVGSVYIFLWIILFLKGRSQENFFRVLREEDYPMKEIFFVGYELLDFMKYSYHSEKDVELRKQLAILYEERYADYYLRVVQSQRVTCASLIIGIGFVFYGLLSELTILIVFFVLGGVAYYYYGQMVSRKIEERSEELLSDFSEIVSELALLTNAGMVLREAWETVAVKGNSAIYLEMKRVVQEIHNGMSEREAYYRFGVRCIIPEIKKFTSTILQGMTKGNQELGNMLQEQSSVIWKQKKQSVEQLAQTAETKLLLPMGIMFIGILVLIVVPIFSNLGSV